MNGALYAGERCPTMGIRRFSPLLIKSAQVCVSFIIHVEASEGLILLLAQQSGSDPTAGTELLKAIVSGACPPST